jgi:hypothetical protein
MASLVGKDDLNTYTMLTLNHHTKTWQYTHGEKPVFNCGHDFLHKRIEEACYRFGHILCPKV